ncbi:hypothetical protein WJ22_13170 [Burkholderia vietnamiensis]|nr:hypothetical protein WJ18_06940 [Burkholderia vietnamiensis]KVF85929.1 hypothetical protein WJ20_24550 [Burkholderia vietnamiensis]KVF89470.1 hypothetical protein WJ19_05955 [Burkholderia vietnamiensis]KVG01309.1 hypothetical protein WJ22_13170 [Burkholderia vietnamiensis]
MLGELPQRFTVLRPCIGLDLDRSRSIGRDYGLTVTTAQRHVPEEANIFCADRLFVSFEVRMHVSILGLRHRFTRPMRDKRRAALPSVPLYRLSCAVVFTRHEVGIHALQSEHHVIVRIFTEIHL